MVKKLLISIFLLVIMSMAVSAFDSKVNIDTLTRPHGSFTTQTTFIPMFNVTGNNSNGTWTCHLWGNFNGTSPADAYRELETVTTVANATNTNFTSLVGLTDANYTWNVFCNCTDFGTGNWSVSAFGTGNVNSSFTVDTTLPTFSSIYPNSVLGGLNQLWVNNQFLFPDGFANSSVRIGANVTELHPDRCVLWINYGNNTNASSMNITRLTNSYTNMIPFNHSNINGTIGFAENLTGYTWTMACNDSAGNSNSMGGLFKVDTILPAPFIFNTSDFKTDANYNILNFSYVTDYMPQIGWNISVENNFNAMRIRVYNSSVNYTPAYIELEFNITSNETARTNLTSELKGDRTFTFLLTLFDNAFNQINMTQMHYTFNTVSLCHNLSAGWNVCGNPGNNLTLSTIVNLTGASTVSYWNRSNEFQSFVSGGTSNGAVTVGGGYPMFIYMDSKDTFNDLVRTVSNISPRLTHEVVNGTQSDWNIIVNKNDSADYTLQILDIGFNCFNGSYGGVRTDRNGVVALGGPCKPGGINATNISVFDYWNNSASTGAKYIPFVANWSISNQTTVKFMEPVWVLMANANTPIIEYDWGVAR